VLENLDKSPTKLIQAVKLCRRCMGPLLRVQCLKMWRYLPLLVKKLATWHYMSTFPFFCISIGDA
jgi:hypothetical protein